MQMKKRSQKQKEEIHTSEDLKRYLGILHEEHMRAIKGMGEHFIEISRRFDRVERTQESHTEMIGQMKEDIEVIKSDIGIIKTDLKQKVDRSEFAVLERRVLRLESKVR
ncbi:MAG: hypothetical protein A3H73_03210 [Candidatus Taylorbacteria bacterium RIFCSPLOWO2_02_FULL_50_120]|nr:MAG: hypothetical protein UY62_C0013G0007 [Parcubacteria group bacterium GW2011_GWF2_50_9]OHA35532.1 MAG: hypothetical protein A2W65_00530 [Candidatus Taylorbacteria bacterium RIFCSPLOWO2_02_50_13]OHA43017.1 MAG: hypothetical protein A3H73_03210 [Candidatus Taylorbacteria bacterium RIFCSPLOWO2_02_FULL_50_120]OHA45778.1 MAG: hypothetical protein A3G61_02900 [Candidatus Taylorbacteria bacterium RIFCSPLOWO2_12_FULL_49_67]HBT81555.1 hypothetical protein [Candidatus Giovannonibacteria bacterium]